MKPLKKTGLMHCNSIRFTRHLAAVSLGGAMRLGVARMLFTALLPVALAPDSMRPMNRE
jgi:hypothetical protein